MSAALVKLEALMVPQLDEDAEAGVVKVDYSRDLPMDLSTLLENVLDPSHLPFTHHNTISKRSNARPVAISVDPSSFGPGGFTAKRNAAAAAPPTATATTAATSTTPPTTDNDAHDAIYESGETAADKSGGAGASGGITFKAPHHVISVTNRPGSFSDWNVVYGLPLREGACRVFVRVVFEVGAMTQPSKTLFSALFTRTPVWLLHCNNHRVLEDDNVFLHAQEEALFLDSFPAPAAARDLHPPTSAAAAVHAAGSREEDEGEEEGLFNSDLLAALPLPSSTDNENKRKRKEGEQAARRLPEQEAEAHEEGGGGGGGGGGERSSGGRGGSRRRPYVVGGETQKRWRERYFLPTKADACVAWYQVWLERYGCSELVLPPPPSSRGGSGIIVPREELIERRRSHTEHCSACAGALKTSEAVLSAARVLAYLFLALFAAASSSPLPSPVLDPNAVETGSAGLSLLLQPPQQFQAPGMATPTTDWVINPAAPLLLLGFSAGAALVASAAELAILRLTVGDYPPPRNQR